MYGKRVAAATAVICCGAIGLIAMTLPWVRIDRRGSGGSVIEASAWGPTSSATVDPQTSPGLDTLAILGGAGLAAAMFIALLTTRRDRGSAWLPISGLISAATAAGCVGILAGSPHRVAETLIAVATSSQRPAAVDTTLLPIIAAVAAAVTAAAALAVLALDTAERVRVTAAPERSGRLVTGMVSVNRS